MHFFALLFSFLLSLFHTLSLSLFHFLLTNRYSIMHCLHKIMYKYCIYMFMFTYDKGVSSSFAYDDPSFVNV